MKETARNSSILHRVTPLVLLTLLVLAFGLMIPWLGYGFDDWHFIYYSTRGHEGLAELFHYDGHPQATWSYTQSFRILGYSPLYWHLYSLFWRWLAVLSFWLCLQTIWPDHRRQNFFAAALFILHPIFTLQVFPISFFEVWIGYTLLFLSFYFSIRAVQIPEKHRIFTLLAVVLAIGHVFTREYGWFVELMRPVFIWLVLPPKDSPQKRISQIVKIWFPFFAVFIASLIWRGFFYSPVRRYFQVQDDLFANPLRTLLVWVSHLIPDISIVLLTSWYETIRSEYLYLVRPFNGILLALVILLAVIIGVYTRRIDHASQSEESWSAQAFFLGLPSVLFGILPFYIASYSIHLTDPPHNSRLAIGMLPGAALISAAVVEKFISRQNLRILVTAIVLSLAVGWHIRYTNDYRAIWAYQSPMLQQLTWRIPALEKNTALFIWQPSPPRIDHPDPEIALVGDFHLSMAINSIYQIDPDPADSKLSYWYYYLSGDSIDIPKDTLLREEHATTSFTANAQDSLYFYYDPQNGRCLHLVNAEDQYYKQYPDTIRKLSPATNMDRILPGLAQNTGLRDEIWKGGEQTWCFYYQKAELARQYEDWDEIPSLWKAAAENDLDTAFGTEYIPFIDGFARTADWQKAKDLTIRANKLSKGMNSILCPLWTEIENSTPAAEERDATIQQIKNVLDCADQ